MADSTGTRPWNAHEIMVIPWNYRESTGMASLAIKKILRLAGKPYVLGISYAAHRITPADGRKKKEKKKAFDWSVEKKLTIAPSEIHGLLGASEVPEILGSPGNYHGNVHGRTIPRSGICNPPTYRK